MNWIELKQIRKWTSLKALPFNSERLGEVLFKIENQAYLIAVPYNERCERTNDGPFVTLLMWAQSDGAAKRADASEIENDVINEILPPREMLLSEEAYSFKKIINELKSGKYGGYFKSAEYRIATDGAFVHRKVESDFYEFYFRNLKEKSAEVPYSIVYRLQ